MAKNSVADWDTTAANNTDVGGIDIDEGCAPSGINNSLREIMAQIASSDLGTLEGLANTDGNVIVGDGSTWVVESGATLRTSLGLTIGTDVQAYDADTAKLDVAQTWTAVQKFDGSNGLRTKSASVGTGPSYVRFEDSAATSLGSVGAGSGLTDDISLNATSGDLLLNCASGTAFLNSNPIASVYTGSSTDNATFPIGTPIPVWVDSFDGSGSVSIGSMPARRASVTPVVPSWGGSTGGKDGDNLYQNGGTGTSLTGTWLATGQCGDSFFMAVRVS